METLLLRRKERRRHRAEGEREWRKGQRLEWRGGTQNVGMVAQNRADGQDEEEEGG